MLYYFSYKNQKWYEKYDSNNYVIIRKFDMRGKLYDGFGFNKKDKSRV